MNRTMRKPVFGKGASGVRTETRAKPEALSAPILAMQLLGRWTRMAQGHIAVGMGCSCCNHVGNVQVQDMEQHILDYLDTKYKALKVPSVSDLLADKADYKPGESGSITELLRAVAAQSSIAIPPKDQLSLLEDLTRSIDSLDDKLQGRV